MDSFQDSTLKAQRAMIELMLELRAIGGANDDLDRTIWNHHDPWQEKHSLGAGDDLDSM